MLNEIELARRSGSGIQVRPGGLRLRWELTGLTTADGHVARGAFSATARALPDPNNLRMLDEALLGARSALTNADVIAYFAEPISAAARKYALGAQANALVADEGRQAMLHALMEAAGAVAFGCGIEIIQPAQVDLDCPTLSRQRVEEMERQSAQRRATEQVDHLRRSTELFQQFQALRSAAPQLSPGEVLSQISPADQAEVFRAALVSSVQTSAPEKLWAAAGNGLVAIDRQSVESPQLIEVPGQLGPIRSARGDADGGMLLGCRSGVLCFDPNTPADSTAFGDPGTTSQLGFNSAVVLGERLWAVHGEAGLVGWDLNRPEKPAVAIRPEDAKLGDAKIANFSPRCLSALDANRLIFSSGAKLIVASKDGEMTAVAEGAGAEIMGVFVQSSRVVTAHADGQVCSWSVGDLKLECKQRRCGRVTAAAMLPWMGDSRLLLATEEGPIFCVGLDDELVSQFLGPYPGLRIVAAAGNAVAAVTGDRQRVVVWHAWDGKMPATDLYLYGLARHRITELIFM